MTLLSNQLLSLRTATARHQTVEKRHVSLLFEKKEAQELDRESAFKIGCDGLKKLAQLDGVFNEENDLFHESRLHFHRSMISKEEDALLNRKIEKFLFQLSPYMQHFACQQVLEWLVYKYQVYAYNAETMILTFIPFHETNFFGRMLSIIEYNFSTSKDWGFLEGFCKKEYPVPFSAILKATLSSTHSLITKISDHLIKGIEIVGEEFVEKKCHMLFIFYAKLLTGVLGESKKVSDDLLAKIIPLVAIGLRSPLFSFRQTSLIVICQIAISTTLTQEVTESLIKIVSMKLRKSSLDNSIATLTVICQRQTLQSFPTRAVIKMLHRANELCVWATIKNLCLKSDLSTLLKPLWQTFLHVISEDVYETDHKNCLDALQETSEPEILHGSQAAAFLRKLLDHSEVQYLYANKKFCDHVRSLVARFSDQWLEICSEWNSCNSTSLNDFVKNYKLEPYMVLQVTTEKSRKRRRSNTSIQESSPNDLSVNIPAKRKNAAERADELASSSQFSLREAFAGDPMKKAREWIKKEMWDNVAWAFEEMAARHSYFAHKVEEEIEIFILEVIEMAVKSIRCPVISQARCAFNEVNLQSDFIVSLLSPREKWESFLKAAGSTNVLDILTKKFQDETSEQFDKRIIFVLEMLNSRSTPIVNAQIFHVLFGTLKESCAEKDELTIQVVHLLIKMLKSSGKYQVSSTDLNIDLVVEIMRTTQNHNILRQLLRLLTAAVQLSPANVVSHMMSIFTFMGSGILRKDNELTLGIIEDTLEALFGALCTQNEKISAYEMHIRLVDVARVFAASACDIPAHRRKCMANAIARAVRHSNVWIISGVIVEHYCAMWQRSVSDTNKRFSDFDAFEDLALELCSGLDPLHQFCVIADVIDFIVRLGGDDCHSESKENNLDQAIFDRSKHSLPKLRHFRFVMIGLVVKILCCRKLYEKLGEIDDNSLYHSLLPIGKRLMTASVELDDFVTSEREMAERSREHQTLRYWIALSNRADNVSEKLRHVFPGGVAAKFIINILEDEKTDWKMREKALQLANSKLIHDGFFFSEGGINDQHLEKMIAVLNKWIVKERKSHEKVILCQNAAYSLKLVAKRLSHCSDPSIFAETMERCTNLIADYQTLDDFMVGNVTLLAGELIRFRNMKTTMASVNPLLNTCLSMLKEYSFNHKENEEPINLLEEEPSRQQRLRQKSLSGRKLGSATLLICALTCVQRIVDQFAPFVSKFLSDIIIQTSYLFGRYCESNEVSDVTQAIDKSQILQNTKGVIQYRINLIRSALVKLEPRVLPEHFSRAVVEVALNEKALMALFSLLKNYFNQRNHVIITRIRETLMTEVFLIGLEHRAHCRNAESLDSVIVVENSVFKALLAMAEILTENSFRSVMNIFVSWAEAVSKSSAVVNNRCRLIVLFRFANSFYDSFNSLSLPYFGKLITIANKVLRGCESSILNGEKKLIDSLEDDLLLTNVIDFIANCARHREFFSQDRVELLIEPLVNEIMNIKSSGHRERCVNHLSNALYNISDIHPDNFQAILDKILLMTRSNKAKIRHRSLLVIGAMFDKVGDGVAPYLPMIVPFLSELLEDENRKVEAQCEYVVRLLQDKFGENICEGFL